MKPVKIYKEIFCTFKFIYLYSELQTHYFIWDLSQHQEVLSFDFC